MLCWRAEYRMFPNPQKFLLDSSEVKYNNFYIWKGVKTNLCYLFLYFLNCIVIQTMIKMCTYKRTEEQPRMHDNDVESLNMRLMFTGSIHWKGQETLTNPVTISNCSLCTEFSKHISHWKEPGLLEKCLISGLGKDCTRWVWTELS